MGRRIGEQSSLEKESKRTQAESETSFFLRNLRRHQMKLDPENRKRSVAVLVLSGVALVLIGRVLISSDGLYFPTQAALRNGSALDDHPSERMGGDSSVLDPTIRYAQLQIIEKERYQGSGRNIFRDEAAPIRGEHSPALLPPPPTPVPAAAEPQIALRLFGFVSLLDVPRKGCFGDGDDLFVAGEGQIVNRRYRILKVKTNSVEVEDLIEHSKHTLSLPG
jgi:hypothetical protein